MATLALVLPDAPDMESLGLNAVNAAKAAGVRRLLWFSSFGAKQDNQARFSRRHPMIDEAVCRLAFRNWIESSHRVISWSRLLLTHGGSDRQSGSPAMGGRGYSIAPSFRA